MSASSHSATTLIVQVQEIMELLQWLGIIIIIIVTSLNSRELINTNSSGSWKHLEQEP